VAESENPITLALRGENPLVMARMRSGFAVIGNTQFLPGYSVLLPANEYVDHPTDLPWLDRRAFFFDLTILGEAVLNARRKHGAWRINYEVLGNFWPHMHGHVHARNSSESADKIGGPVWRYPAEVRNSPEFANDDEKHGELRAEITAELEKAMADAYAAAPE
jgi:diadenosine tetraphosphate (Ap4A) HIT family hydrolase